MPFDSERMKQAAVARHPDSPNQPAFPPAVVRPDRAFTSTPAFKFSAK